MRPQSCDTAPAGQYAGENTKERLCYPCRVVLLHFNCFFNWIDQFLLFLRCKKPCFGGCKDALIKEHLSAFAALRRQCSTRGLG